MPRKKKSDETLLNLQENMANLSVASNKIKPKFSGVAEDFEESMQRKAETEKSLTEWSKITTAFKKQLVVRGTVESSMPMEGFGSAVAFVSVYGFSVLIPYDEMLKQSPLAGDLSKELRIRRENNILSGMIGANVDLIIKEINEVPETKEYIVIGSRTQAMDIQKAFYLNKDEHGETKVHAGNIVKADIISVSRGVMNISLFGYEKKLDIFLATAKYTEGLNLMYSPGDTLNVKVHQIDYNDDGCVSNVLVDRRSVEVEELVKKNGHKVKLGGFANAYITSISKRDDGMVPTYRLYIPSWDIPAISWYTYVNNFNKSLCSGDLVLVHVEDFNGKQEAIVTIQRKIK